MPNVIFLARKLHNKTIQWLYQSLNLS
uniref:Uncharacterized protein n=1 Tax=Rhizophora mucronata TaxID=61149 RepID=A0A2P2N855_RHIMU